ncbi:MAG: alanine--glyoxylate aminotransferase family protein [Dehalococcoidia bacterium]|nr:alanine--glyoxylate aminotransferase family protein [Dehalococcoidia bacterium]
MLNLRIPGPTPVPDSVAQAGAADMINHRGPEFADLINRSTTQLKQVFETKNDLFILTASGTGGMEAAVANHVNAGEKVLVVTVGVFGKRFVEIVRVFGGNPIELDFEFGRAADPNRIEEILNQHSDIRVVMITHNETSTGVTNNDLEVVSGICKSHDCLLIVDAISSLSSIPVRTDEWELDVVISGSQKGWMTAPGLAFISCSEKAWEKSAQVSSPRFYFDLLKAKDYLAMGQTPSTPAVSVMFQLDKALEIMFDEGLQNIYARHHRHAQVTRDGIRALGLELFAEEGSESDTVTSVRVPDSIDGLEFLEIARSQYGTVFAGGQGALKGQIFRFGHLGFVTDEHIQQGLSAIEKTLHKLRS